MRGGATGGATDATGTRIAEEREQLGMTQTLLASLAGIDRDKLNKIEHGRRRVTSDEALKLAIVLGLTPEDLASSTSAMQFRERVDTPESEAVIRLFEQYVHNWRVIDGLRDFHAD